MGCFNNCNCISPNSNSIDNCCNANHLCDFDGDMSKVVAEPIYVQKVYDAVLLNLQGLKTVSNQTFTPAIPSGFRLTGIAGIKCKKCFNPANIADPNNLTISCNTTISGASFVNDANGEVKVVGPDGSMSEKLLYVDTSTCDRTDKGTPIFGTQKVSISGNVCVTLDLIVMDNCGREICYPVSANVNIATVAAPLLLTSFFEMCMPSVFDTAFLPRFAELCNVACETRLATNSLGRDLTIDSNGEVSANLIIAMCVNCEKKIVVPVELCVLSTGFLELSPNTSQVCANFPQLFPTQINKDDDDDVAGDTDNGGCCGNNNNVLGNMNINNNCNTCNTCNDNCNTCNNNCNNNCNTCGDGCARPVCDTCGNEPFPIIR